MQRIVVIVDNDVSAGVVVVFVDVFDDVVVFIFFLMFALAWLCLQCCVCLHHKSPATDYKLSGSFSGPVNRRNSQIQAEKLDDTRGSRRTATRTTFKMSKFTFSWISGNPGLRNSDVQWKNWWTVCEWWRASYNWGETLMTLSEHYLTWFL